MPTNSLDDGPAVVAALAEAEAWADLSREWEPDRHREVWADVPGRESAVIPEVDPSADLVTRARRWGYDLGRGDLSDVAMFAAALAKMEAESWRLDDPAVATQAYSDRRSLAANRLIPWAVPWVRALARCFPDERRAATVAGATLLAIGDRHKSAPLLTGREGVVLPGHDGYGPISRRGDAGDRLGSLWGGTVVFRRSLESMTGASLATRSVDDAWLADEAFRSAVGAWYRIAESRWRALAQQHPGTARYWLDLADRASATAVVV